MGLPIEDTLGESVPPDTRHAVSVSLPSWRSNVGYEEGEDWVVKKMKTGYPRFFIHNSIKKLASDIIAAYGNPNSENAMLLPTIACATRCREFILQQFPDADSCIVRILNFVPNPERPAAAPFDQILPKISAVIYPAQLQPAAKAFWQHTGEGVQSRRAEFCQRAWDEGRLVDAATVNASVSTPTTVPRLAKGPRRYQRALSKDLTNVDVTNGQTETAKDRDSDSPSPTSPVSAAITSDGAATNGVSDSAQFVEERYGRNLNTAFAAQAKLAIKRRIAGLLSSDADLPDSLCDPVDETRQRDRQVPGFSSDDVYLHPCGMNAIFTAHRVLLQARGPMKSIMYGFPYVDTLKVLEKFGPGALFYGHGDAAALDDLERRLEAGERYLALFCEFPGNPLLMTPDLTRIRALADRYDFAVVVDETIGNLLNVRVLPQTDVVVSSLTKIFSGDGNVMGGSMILRPGGRYYAALKAVLATDYEDNQFEEDSVYLERNSRDFAARIARIDANAEAIVDVLCAAQPGKVKNVYYPKVAPSRKFYDEHRLPDGGYGGLLSATFYSVEDAATFYDALQVHKGPSLGTNFTLASPFVLLAHYGELEWAAQFGCEMSLVRFSVGLEETGELQTLFAKALEAVPSRS